MSEHVCKCRECKPEQLMETLKEFVHREISEAMTNAARMGRRAPHIELGRFEPFDINVDQSDRA